jgi:hypothetical protein
MIIQAFECEGNLSLDADYLVRLSDGKFAVRPVYALLDEEALKKLNDVNKNAFDFDIYDSLREKCDPSQDDYFIANAKCISINSYEVKTFLTAKTLENYLEEENE